MVKADTALVRIPHLEFEIPPNTQKGKVSTVESILSQAVQDIEMEQPVRKVHCCVITSLYYIPTFFVKVMQPEAAKKLDEFIHRLKECLEFSEPFVLVRLCSSLYVCVTFAYEILPSRLIIYMFSSTQDCSV